ESDEGSHFSGGGGNAVPGTAAVIGAVHAAGRQAHTGLRDVCGDQNQIRIGGINGDVADVRAAVAEKAESEIAVGADDRARGALYGASVRPRNPPTRHLQNARARITVATAISLFAGTGVNDSGAT